MLPIHKKNSVSEVTPQTKEYHSAEPEFEKIQYKAKNGGEKSLFASTPSSKGCNAWEGFSFQVFQQSASTGGYIGYFGFQTSLFDG